MARVHVTSGSPSSWASPEAEYAEETIFDWLRRQNDPKKPINKKSRREGNRDGSDS